MNKPDEISQKAWDAATDAVGVAELWGDRDLRSRIIARIARVIDVERAVLGELVEWLADREDTYNTMASCAREDDYARRTFSPVPYHEANARIHAAKATAYGACRSHALAALKQSQEG